MSLIALGVTIGSPDTTGIVPITTSDLAADIAQARTDLATLQTNIDTTQTACSTADTDMGTLQTAVTTAKSAADTSVTNATTVDSDVGTVTSAQTTFLADYDAVAAAIIAITGDTYATHQFTFGGSTGLTSAQLHTQMTALNTAITAFLAGGITFTSFLYQYDAAAAAIVAISGDTYSSATHQFTTGGSTALTHAQWAGSTIGVALNSAITSFLAGQTWFTTLKTATTTAKTQATTTQTDLATCVTDASTTKTATATALTDADALSTTTTDNDLVDAQAIIASANVLIQTDDTMVTTQSAFSAAVLSALAFIKNKLILPT